MKEDEDVQKANLEHCSLFLSWLRLLRTVCKQCTNYFQAAQPHRTTCSNSSPADSHPLDESLFQDVFDVQSFKCEIVFPLGFLSSCASCSPLCALVCSPVNCAYCLPVSWECSRTQSGKLIWGWQVAWSCRIANVLSSYCLVATGLMLADYNSVASHFRFI
uniref:Uncharacterized protein n=1 Tax=Meleagris gallopavo TaxID=9103 RepID=A0A803YGC2_MELGA